MDIKDKKQDLPFKSRPLIFLDLETTGLKSQRHEIIEIGAIKTSSDQPFEIIGQLSIKVRPKKIETADKDSLKVNGYSEEGWKEAVELTDALDLVDEFAAEGILVGYNISFDWAFLDKAYFSLGRQDPFHYHRIDVLSMAYQKFMATTPLKKYSLSDVCAALKIHRENKHQALADAKTTYLVFKSLIS